MLHVNSRETTFEHQRVPAARFNNILACEQALGSFSLSPVPRSTKGLFTG